MRSTPSAKSLPPNSPRIIGLGNWELSKRQLNSTLWRNRWYWRDERIARVGRTWRLAYQPLTSTWRVGLGGLSQSFPTLDEAMVVVTRTAQWRLAELAQVDPDSRHYVEFFWRLDTSQLPSPMLIGLTGASDFSLGAERTLKLE